MNLEELVEKLESIVGLKATVTPVKVKHSFAHARSCNFYDSEGKSVEHTFISSDDGYHWFVVFGPFVAKYCIPEKCTN